MVISNSAEESLSKLEKHELLFLGEIPPQSMATTIDDGLSSGREGLSDGEIKPQKLKRMKNHLGLALKHFAVSVEKDKTVSCNVFITSCYRLMSCHSGNICSEWQF